MIRTAGEIDAAFETIARIERQYVVVWPREQRSAKTAIMALAIDMALDGLKLQKRRA